MGFTTDSDITLDVAPANTPTGTVYKVHAKINGGNVELFKHYACQESYGSDPQFPVPFGELGVLYFWVESPGYLFPSPPVTWHQGGQQIAQPSTISDQKMTPDECSFSIQIDNTAHPSSEGDVSRSFTLHLTPEDPSSGLREVSVDPTIIEKGSEGDG